MAMWSAYNLAVADPPGDGALVFNTRTGALVRLDGSRLRQLESPDPLPVNFAEFLLREGFLAPDGCDELGLIRGRQVEARADVDSFTATVELTESCNFRCGYCYQDHRPRRLDRGLGDRVVAYLVEQMRGRRHLHVNWFGGEPLLAFVRLREMSGALSAAAGESWTLTQFITTNGYLLTRRRAAELVDLGVTSAQITVDGEAAEHDRSRPFLDGRPTYRRVLAGCVNAVAAGMSLVLRINVSRSNVASVPVLVEQLRPQGLVPANTVVHVTRMVDHGNGTGDGETARSALTVPEFAEAWVGILGALADQGFALPPLDPAPYNCPFDLESTVMIGCDGSLRQCSSSSSPLARLAEDGGETGRLPLHERVKARDPMADPACRDCRDLPLCMGGCSYLEELGQEKCPPEHYVLPQLVALTARRMMERR